MNTTDEIMELACIYADATNEALYEDRRVAIARRDLRTAIVELVEQANWAHHTPALLSEADAAADLAGVARPGAEPVAWVYQNTNTDTEYLVWKRSSGGRNWRPLYTAPPQASQSLTDDQWQRIGDTLDCFITRDERNEIEAVLGIGAAQKGKPAQDAIDAERWRAFLSTRSTNTHSGINQAIDAAIAAQKGKP